MLKPKVKIVRSPAPWIVLVFLIIAFFIAGFFAGHYYQAYKQKKCTEISPKTLNIKDTKIMHDVELETSS